MPLSLTRRMAIGATIAIACAVAQAQWPERPIKIIVPSAAGGAPDNLTRLVSNELAKRARYTVVIENRPGAAGNIGMQAVATSAADGYTIGYGNNVTLATNEFLFSKLPYDPHKLEPIIVLSQTASLLVVNHKLPVNTVQELIAYAKQNPGKLTFASGGTGTSGHIGAELFKLMTGIEATHVPYKGAPQALNDLMSGHVDFLIDNYSSAGPHVTAGRVRALAVTALKRSPLFPSVPTLDEAGVKGFEVTAWGGFVAPHGTPPSVIARLNTDINALLQDPEVHAKLVQLGSTVVGGSPQDFRDLIARERVKWGELVRKTGAKVD